MKLAKMLLSFVILLSMFLIPVKGTAKDSYTIKYEPSLSVNNIVLPKNWVFESPDKKLDIGTYTFTIWNPATGDKKNISVTVKKGTPKVSAIKIKLDKPETLTDSMLPASDKGRYTWSKKYTAKKSGTYKCVFIPNDEIHYDRVTLNAKVTVKEIKKKATPKPATTMQPSVITQAENPEPKPTPKIKATEKPTEAPTEEPTEIPTEKPTPTPLPTPEPTPAPTVELTEEPVPETTPAVENSEVTATEIPVSQVGLPTDNPAANPNYVPTIAPSSSDAEMTNEDEDSSENVVKKNDNSLYMKIAIIIVIAIVIGVIIMLIIKTNRRNKFNDFF